MFRKIILATAAMAVATVPGWADDKERLGDFPIDSLSISVEDDDADLTVIYSRMEETATAAVLFGIVGSAINSGINADEDAGRADLFRHLERSKAGDRKTWRIMMSPRPISLLVR